MTLEETDPRSRKLGDAVTSLDQVDGGETIGVCYPGGRMERNMVMFLWCHALDSLAETMEVKAVDQHSHLERITHD